MRERAGQRWRRAALSMLKMILSGRGDEIVAREL
jgi:hypothetical protein